MKTDDDIRTDIEALTGENMEDMFGGGWDEYVLENTNQEEQNGRENKRDIRG